MDGWICYLISSVLASLLFSALDFRVSWQQIVCVVFAQSAGSPAEFKFQRSVDDFVQVQTKFSFSHILPVPVSSLALSLNKQILVFVIIVYYCCLLFVLCVLIADHTAARGVIACWHDTVICLSVRLSQSVLCNASCSKSTNWASIE